MKKEITTDPAIKVQQDIDLLRQTAKNRAWLRYAFISVLVSGLLLLFIDPLGNYILTLIYRSELVAYRDAIANGLSATKPEPPGKFVFLTSSTLTVFKWLLGTFCGTFIAVLSGAKIGDIMSILAAKYGAHKK